MPWQWQKNCLTIHWKYGCASLIIIRLVSKWKLHWGDDKWAFGKRILWFLIRYSSISRWNYYFRLDSMYKWKLYTKTFDKIIFNILNLFLFTTVIAAIPRAIRPIKIYSIILANPLKIFMWQKERLTIHFFI